jgi:hypothetical protein
MAFTRFHDDSCRIQKQLQEDTDPGRYILNVPGNGETPLYMEDPYIRMQKWGANLQTNTINLESDLMGLTRKLTLDCKENNNFKSHSINSKKINYPSQKPFVEQPRAVNPAWTALEVEQNNFDYLFFNPQLNVCMPFYNNLSSRILEKDYYLMRECVPSQINKLCNKS